MKYQSGLLFFVCGRYAVQNKAVLCTERVRNHIRYDSNRHSGVRELILDAFGAEESPLMLVVNVLYK